jgi:uncharacterized protein with ParB-like and HNH nuclease domain
LVLQTDVENRSISVQQIIPLYKSIHGLLSGNKFTIDEYQREYKWEQGNITDLINDLLNKFRASYVVGHSTQNVAKYEDYFLGSIILNKKDIEDKIVFSIVDGQQRITSITLLLIHLYQIGKKKNINQDILFEIQRMIYSDSWGSKAYNLDIADRHVVLEALFKGNEFNYQVHNESVRNMYARYQDIESENIETALGDAFELFLYWFCNRVAIIEISCQSSNQAYDIFETMNDRGRPLSTVDMLKSFFLSHVSDPKKLNYLNSVWRSATFQINTWDNSYHSTREILFFKTWFRSKYMTKPNEVNGRIIDYESERINNAMNRWARENAKRLNWNEEDVIISLVEDELKHYSNIYISILNKTYKFDPLFDSIYYNDETGFSWQPTILLSAIRLNDDENEVSRRLRAVSRYIDFWIVSRFANGKRFKPTDFSKELIELIVDMRDMDFGTLKSYLVERIDSSELQILGGTKGKKSGIRELQLNQYTKKGIKYILARISEYVQRGSTANDGTSFMWYMNHGDIEHIIEDNYYPYADDYDNRSDFDSNRNRIGALLLIASRTNKSLQDRPFTVKKDYYISSGFFAGSLNQNSYVHEPGFREFITKNGFDFKPYEKFGVKETQERTELVAEIAAKIWSRDRILEIE